MTVNFVFHLTLLTLFWWNSLAKKSDYKTDKKVYIRWVLRTVYTHFLCVSNDWQDQFYISLNSMENQNLKKKKKDVTLLKINRH